MTVTNVDQDPTTLTLTLTAEFPAPVERVWQLWADPRQLERWWGPPTWPATVHRHELRPGGEISYTMTGPGGEKSNGWWRVTSVRPPTALEFVDGFADESGQPAGDMPEITVLVDISEQGDTTRMVVRSVFASREHMEKLTGMGMVEGLRQAVSQMDGLLAG